MSSKGKLIIIDGIDGAGKATQVKLLTNKLRKAGFKARKIDFPRYGLKSAGLVEEYLAGKYGNEKEVGPYRASVFYAVDRCAASAKIRKWLDEGAIIVSDRYVSANLGHQGGKIKNKAARQKFYDWLLDLEHNIFCVPKPDLNIILSLEPGLARELFSKRDTGKNRRDIHQESLDHLKRAEKTFSEIAGFLPNAKKIKCSENFKIKTRKEIHKTIWGEVSRILSQQN